jgi:putative SOS response-associated peptidase YedK
VLHVQDGEHRVDDVFWGYRAEMGRGQGADLDQCPLRKIVEPLLVAPAQERSRRRAGRGLVRMDRRKRSQAALAHPAQGWRPLFLLALANFGSFVENRAEAGFVLVTDDASGGMLDIHDRRPVVLEARDAELWLDPALPAEQALELARNAAVAADAFDWHKVGTRVNNAGADGPQITWPLDE